jgi:hypothetical protein
MRMGIDRGVAASGKAVGGGVMTWGGDVGTEGEGVRDFWIFF